MDSKDYQQVETTRGLQYSVYYVKATSQATTLVLLHGFPNSSYDWRYQVDFFTKLGYGVIVPDLLGYGGTDKPLDPALYATSLVARDIVDVIDQLKVEGSLVAIGHDWGSRVAGRLANNHEDRFAAFGFLTVGYQPPNTTLTFQELQESAKKIFGRDLTGYAVFFAEEDAAEVILKHYDAFWDCLLAFEPDTIKQITPIGGFRSYLAKDPSIPLPKYLTPEEAEITKQRFRDTGLKAPLHWYKTMTADIDMKADSKIPKENYHIHKPAFYACALNDAVAIPAFFEATSKQYISQLTVHKYEATHWVHWEKREEVNRDLLSWLESSRL
ncbi:alpha/beta-hydrolase [Crepidotus variabilis]|uniref:Alpha/beta-hydrolase n=1 Tax=Crepidotus variabilis TaxID=179855 RepID=A0A9P6E940_9AGAR|nr:alpha/beta-hydrolase [Crepidotus variabilis]